MPSLSGEDLKVYLYMNYLYSAGQFSNITAKMLSNELHMDVETVLQSLGVLEQLKLIIPQPGSTADNMSYKFTSLRQRILSSNYVERSSLGDEYIRKDQVDQLVQRRIEEDRNKKLLATFRRGLNSNEVPVSAMNDLFEILADVDNNHELVEHAIKVTASHSNFANKNNIKQIRSFLGYMKKCVYNWHEKGFTSVSDVVSFSQNFSSRNAIYYSFKTALGKKNESLAPVETASFDRWLDDYGLSSELILHVLGDMVLQDRKNLNYINPVMQRLHAEGIRSIEDYQQDKAKHKEDRQQTIKNRIDQASKQYKSKLDEYRNIQNHDYDLSLDEINDITKSRK